LAQSAPVIFAQAQEVFAASLVTVLDWETAAQQTVPTWVAVAFAISSPPATSATTSMPGIVLVEPRHGRLSQHRRAAGLLQPAVDPGRQRPVLLNGHGRTAQVMGP
jgi:hypothetical protein